MPMNKPAKLLLAAATIWPFLYVLFFIGVMFATLLAARYDAGAGGDTAYALPVNPIVLFALHLLTMLWIMALTVFYIVHVFRNEHIDNDKKVLWAVVIFMGTIIAMPIYWYLYIWLKGNDRPGATSAA